jgi:hypothetical protein
MCAPATDVVGLRTPATGLPTTTWSRMTATVSQLSHRLGGRHWTEADSLDIQRTLTCGSGFWRTGRTHGIDLRIRRLGVRVPPSAPDLTVYSQVRAVRLVCQRWCRRLYWAGSLTTRTVVRRSFGYGERLGALP